MMKYHTNDGTIIDTTNATASWPEERDWDGSNHIGRSSRSQWVYETLYRSSKGRYYLERVSQWQGTRPSAEFVSEHDAARFLLLNEHELPEDLRAFASEVTE